MEKSIKTSVLHVLGSNEHLTGVQRKIPNQPGVGPWPWAAVGDHPEEVVLRGIFQGKYQKNHVFLQGSCSKQFMS